MGLSKSLEGIQPRWVCTVLVLGIEGVGGGGSTI